MEKPEHGAVTGDEVLAVESGIKSRITCLNPAESAAIVPVKP